jgi:hypothetical protein
MPMHIVPLSMMRGNHIGLINDTQSESATKML